MSHTTTELTTPSLIEAAEFLMERGREGYEMDHPLCQIGFIYYVTVKLRDENYVEPKKPGRPKKEG